MFKSIDVKIDNTSILGHVSSEGEIWQSNGA
jgi:hypothetical protein